MQLNQETNNRAFVEKHMLFIWCECGYGIPLVSNVKNMSRAIEDHVLTHRKKEKNPGRAADTAKRIRDMLIKQVFEKADKSL